MNLKWLNHDIENVFIEIRNGLAILYNKNGIKEFEMPFNDTSSERYRIHSIGKCLKYRVLFCKSKNT